MRIEVKFNGNAELRLFPTDDDDYKILDLLLNNKKLVEIKKPIRDSETQECASFIFSKEK